MRRSPASVAAVERLDLGGKRADEPIQSARGAVVLGEVVRLRKVMGASPSHGPKPICATSMASTESRGRMLAIIEAIKERLTSSVVDFLQNFTEI